MRIHFERGGGFAPTATRLSHTVEAQELPAEAAAELDKLVADSDLADLAGRVPAAPRPDAFHYRLTVEGDDDTTYQVAASDTDMPASLRPLITWLTRHASADR